MRVVLAVALAVLASLLAGHSFRAIRSGIMPMRVSPAHRAHRPGMFRAAVAIELALAAASLAGAGIAGFY